MFASQTANSKVILVATPRTGAALRTVANTDSLHLDYYVAALAVDALGQGKGYARREKRVRVIAGYKRIMCLVDSGSKASLESERAKR